MARTIRRKSERHEYYWVLRDWEIYFSRAHAVRLDPHSKKGRKALARFHSDAGSSGNSAPNWYCKVFDRRLQTLNNRMMRRWVADPSFDPVFQNNHRHNANWSWW